MGAGRSNPLWLDLNFAVAASDLNGWESGTTPIPHPPSIEPIGRRRRYPVQMHGDFQIAPMLAHQIFRLLQCPNLV